MAYYGEFGGDNCAYEPERTITNADRIRAMTDEELAGWLDNMVLNCGGNDVPCRAFCPTNTNGSADCNTAWRDWLKQEVDE